MDASDSEMDADTDAAQPVEPHLLLTEVRNRTGGKEFIEIYNPSDSEISLDDYYLADTGDYLNLPASIASPAIPSQPSDFVVRFPPGNAISAKEVIVVGVGLKPTGPMNEVTLAGFHIDPYEGFPGQEMLEAWPGSVRSDPTLTDEGEGIVLFYWDGVSSLVSDVDIVIAGDKPTDDNLPPDKTGISVTGPSGTSTYKDDAAALPKMPDKLRGMQSYQRVRFEGAHETHDGVGNGITGDDETSEDTTMTWIISDMTPGTIDITD